MRVGIIANTFEETMGSVAGGHIHFLEVAKRWTEFEIFVFGPALARNTIEDLLPNATFVVLPDPARRANRQLRYLARTLCAPLRGGSIRSCDVVLATSHFIPDVVPAILARKRKFAVCVQHVLDSPKRRAGNAFANSISAAMQAVSLAITASCCYSIFVNDQETADRIGIDRRRTEVTLMTNGIEHVLAGATEELPVAPYRSSPSILYLGRLVPTKGVDDLIAAWSSVVDAMPGAKLTIAGTGDERYVDSLQQMTRRNGTAESVTFAGRVSEEEKRRLLRTADVFAFPSKEEGWGIVIAEAMAYEIPCVTYDLPAYRKPFSSGRRSAVVGDIGGFAGHIIEILSDEDLRNRLRREASALSKTFSWTAAAFVEGEALRRLARRP